MNKLKNLLYNTAAILALAVLWVVYVPCAICKALNDIGVIQEFADDILNAIGNFRFRTSQVFRRRSTHNKVVSEIVEQLKSEARQGMDDDTFLTIYHFLEKRFK